MVKAMTEQTQPEQSREPDPAAVDRLVKGVLTFGTTTTRMVDIEHALSTLRTENAQLRHNLKTHESNRASFQTNQESLKNQIFELHNELFASREKVYQLQKRLLGLGALVNEG
jgi:chromosome segregation ATPase